jgi:hypothetical protein
VIAFCDEAQAPDFDDPEYGAEFGRFKLMTIYVAAIKGRGIAAFEAENDAAADIRARDCIFRDDLMVLATDGVPLWDGVTKIDIRRAFPHEEAKWRASRANAIRKGNIEEIDDAWISFLVALTG